MREIKFRAWDTIDKRMRYENDVDGIKEFPSLLAVGFHGLPISITPDSFKETEIVGWNRDHNLILMQYTGLRDKDGKEIYEGDIVRYCDYEYEDGNDWAVTTIEWGGESDYPAFDLKSHPFDSNGLSHIKAMGYSIEVIGNIYEHLHPLPKAPESNESAQAKPEAV